MPSARARSVIAWTIAVEPERAQQLLDERAVDLDLVEREALQIAEARIAGAEIVERDADAHAAQRMEDRDHASRAFQEDRFGDLDLEPVRGRGPLAASACTRCWRGPGLRNWTEETLTATRMSSGQVVAWRQASWITQSPIGTIRPVSSASGMKSAGETRPRSGWFQRISASNAPMRSSRGRTAAGSRARTRRAAIARRRSLSSRAPRLRVARSSRPRRSGRCRRPRPWPDRARGRHA